MDMEKVEILHIDIAKQLPSICFGTETLVIFFWWNDCPVGQIKTFGRVGQRVDLESLIGSEVAADVIARARAIVDAERSGLAAEVPPVSVVICTRDRPEALARCLGALSRQTLPPTQVIVVDNASRDGRTREAALAAGVDYLREDRPGLDIARNTGAKRATGEIVAYTDDDVEVHPRWLERMVAAFVTPAVAAVTGLVLPAELETEPQCYFETHWGFGRGYRPILFGSEFFACDRTYGCPAWEIGAGASMAFRREIFAKAGFFDERLDVGAAGCSGDSEYWHRVLSCGGVCRYEPAAVVFHCHRRDAAGLSQQIYYYMRGHAAALLVQYERSGNIGNLRRALVSMPRWYTVRAAKWLLGRGSERDRFLFRELAGYLSGLAYYMGQPRPDTARRSPLQPSTTVIIPARNAAATLAHTLDSLIAQTARDWDAIIIDDASTDRTTAIAEDYARRDARIRWLEGLGEGASAARNLGLSHAAGRWLLFLDSDDWIAPDFLAKMTAAIDREFGAVAAYCADRRVTPSGEFTNPRFSGEIARAPLEAFARHCEVAIHAVLVERSAVMEVGGFDPLLRTCEDWDLWQRVARLGRRFVGIPEPLAYYRMSDQSLTNDFAQMIADARTVIGRGFAPDPRVPKPMPAFAAGASGGGAEDALSYFVLWCAAAAVGRGDDGAALMRGFSTPSNLKDSVPATAAMIVDALKVGTRQTEAALGGSWAAFVEPLSTLLRLCEEASSRKGLGRQLQYAIEREILRHSDPAKPTPLGFTMGARLDLRNLASVSPPAGIDLLYARICAGPQTVGTAEWPVFGVLPARELAELLIDALGIRRYWQAARLYLAARWWLISAGKLLQNGGEIARSRSLRATLRNVAQSAAIETAGPASPASSRVRLDALIAETRRQAGISTARALSTAPLSGTVAMNDRRSFWESFFETPDPWNYGSDYEQTKYLRTLELIRPGTHRALEIGCAEGHFTSLLAERVEEVVAVDISETALKRARDRCEGRANVRFERLDFSTDPLPDALDLIVCSEVLYYLKDEAELSRICDRLVDALAPDGRLLSAHSFVLKDDLRRTGFDWDSPFGAKTIAESLSRVSRLALVRSIQTELYRIDLWQRVAASEPRPEAAVEAASIGAALTPDVARFIVWGGAATDVGRATPTHRVPVLLYHRIATDGHPGLSRYRVSPDRFFEQVRWLRRHGFHALTSTELVEHMAASRPLLGRPVVITFDDGTVDFHHEAWPILRENYFLAEVFVVTDLAGTSATWDAEFEPPPPLMDQAQIQALAREGVRFGSHLATHQAADCLSSRDLVVELVRSRMTLENWLGRPIYAFAAPFGFINERLARAAAFCGYKIGFTTECGVARPGANPLRLPRIEVKGDWTLETFAEALEKTW